MLSLCCVNFKSLPSNVIVLAYQIYFILQRQTIKAMKSYIIMYHTNGSDAHGDFKLPIYFDINRVIFKNGSCNVVLKYKYKTVKI